MTTDERGYFREDLRRYGDRPWFREQSVWALAVHRFGRWAARRPGLVGRLAGYVYWLLYRVVETLTGISIPRTVSLGPGCRIWHFGGIVVHGQATIGANCTLRHGLTVGMRVENGPVPVIEDDVDIGPYAQILGGVRIGRGAQIGVMAVVLQDVPPGATAVGNPARILPAKSGTPST